jgi:hypothetical protein
VNDKKSETIKNVFLDSKIDLTIPTVIVTDLDRAYPQILDELFGDNLLHQPCLFHLQKIILKSYSKNCSIYEELLKYRLLNIFYDHSQEIEWLTQWIKEETIIQNHCSKAEYRKWLKTKKEEFYQFCKKLKSTKSRHKIRTYEEIMDNMLNLLSNIEEFPLEVQKRLKMIDRLFLKLTNFCDSELIPKTNNIVENYFFRTINMDWKKRMKTDAGFLNHLKLQSIRISGVLNEVKMTIIDVFCAIRVFCNYYG